MHTQTHVSRYSDLNPDILFGGDINLPHVKWPSGESDKQASKDERRMTEMLKDFSGDLFLTQQITTETHEKGNVLDLVFTNNVHKFHSHTVTPSTLSDHYIIECALKNDKCKNDEGKTTSTSNFPNIFSSLNFYSEEIKWKDISKTFKKCDWSNLLKDIDPENMTKIFT